MKNKTKIMTELGIIVAVYVALVLVVPMLSFGPIQFRVAELMNFLILVNPIYAIGVIGGVFLSNFFSAYGVGLDLLFGTLHTAISFAICYGLFKKFKEEKSQFAIIVIVFSAMMWIIAFEISLMEQSFASFLPMYGTLFLSEFVVLAIGSVVMYKVVAILKKRLNN